MQAKLRNYYYAIWKTAECQSLKSREIIEKKFKTHWDATWLATAVVGYASKFAAPFSVALFFWANKLNAAHSTARSHSQFNKLKVFVLWPTSRLSRTRSRVGVGVRVLEVAGKRQKQAKQKGQNRWADG